MHVHILMLCKRCGILVEVAIEAAMRNSLFTTSLHCAFLFEQVALIRIEFQKKKARQPCKNFIVYFELLQLIIIGEDAQQAALVRRRELIDWADSQPAGDEPALPAFARPVTGDGHIRKYRW